MNALKQWWGGLAAREQSMLTLAAVVVGLALLWLVAIAPAVQTLRASEAQHAQADAHLQSMQALAAQAKQLRTQRLLSSEESQRNLENSVKQTFGTSATLSVTDARASLTLKAAPPDALALWLSQARINARVVPSEARLQRSASSPASPTPSPVLWDGVMVLALPGR
jgi:general secretion pathway protein M